MKNLITIAALALTVASTAYAADDKSTDKPAGMIENCQHHMKDGKMMDSMPKDMMGQCHKMMKDGGMMKGGMMSQDGMKDMKPEDAAKTETPKTDDANHKAHHPAQ